MIVNISSVPPKYLPKIWPQVIPHLLKGEKYWERFYSLDDICAEILAQRMQLWVMIIDKKIKCILLTCIVSYPRGDYLRYVYIGGEGLRVAKDYAYIVENWARERGAIGFEVLGRDPWLRWMKSNKVGSFDKIKQRASWFVGDL